MNFEHDLTKSEQQNEEALTRLKEEYAAMSRLERIRHLGTAVDLSNRIARIEGMLRERRRAYDFPHHTDQESLADDTTPDTLVSSIEDE